MVPNNESTSFILSVSFWGLWIKRNTMWCTSSWLFLAGIGPCSFIGLFVALLALQPPLSCRAALRAMVSQSHLRSGYGISCFDNFRTSFPKCIKSFREGHNFQIYLYIQFHTYMIHMCVSSEPTLSYKLDHGGCSNGWSRRSFPIWVQLRWGSGGMVWMVCMGFKFRHTAWY